MSESTTIHPVPLCDLKAQFRELEDEVRLAIDGVLESQQFIMGPQIAKLEGKIADYCGTRHAVGCSSGSDALLLSLMALDIGPGDEVITTPYTFFATAGSISRLRAKPVFVDIEPEGFNINPSLLTSVITPRTKAIMPVHLFGQTAEMDPILAVAEKHGLAVVEDAAQAIGARYNDRAAGSMGTMGCFSFFPSKNLGCMGDGGMVVTNDDFLAQKMRVLRKHGAETKYHHTYVGGNFRLDTIQAAILLVKLRRLDHWNESRRQHAANYRRLIEATSLHSVCTCPTELSGRLHVYNQFVVRSQIRDRLVRELRELGIGSAIYYPEPLHVQECFHDLGYAAGDLPESERAASETLALPMFPELTTEQQHSVVAAIRDSVVASDGNVS